MMPPLPNLLLLKGVDDEEILELFPNVDVAAAAAATSAGGAPPGPEVRPLPYGPLPIRPVPVGFGPR